MWVPMHRQPSFSMKKRRRLETLFPGFLDDYIEADNERVASLHNGTNMSTDSDRGNSNKRSRVDVTDPRDIVINDDWATVNGPEAKKTTIKEEQVVGLGGFKPLQNQSKVSNEVGNAFGSTTEQNKAICFTANKNIRDDEINKNNVRAIIFNSGLGKARSNPEAVWRSFEYFAKIAKTFPSQENHPMLTPLEIFMENESKTSNTMLDKESIDNAVTEIKESLEHPPDRWRPLCAYVRGIGGGKSRVCYEIVKKLESDKDILTLGMSFNCGTSLQGYDHLIEPIDKYAQTNLCLSFITRLFSTYYGISIEKIIKAFKENGEFESISKEIFIYYNADTIRGALTHLMNHSEKIKIVVIVDETKKEFSGHFKSSLFLTSLQVNGILETPSQRQVIPLTITDAFDTEQIVNEWWLKKDSMNITAEGDDKIIMKRLTAIASLVRSLPRTCEIIDTYLKKKITYIDNKAVIKIEKFSFNDLWNYLNKQFQGMYGGTAGFPNPKVFHALLFGIPLRLEDDVMLSTYIQQSVITNSLKKLEDKASYYLESSLVSLYNCLKSDSNPPVSAKLMMSLLDYIVKHFHEMKPENFGSLLEDCLAKWLLVRLMACREANEYSINLSKLFLNNFSATENDLNSNTWQQQFLENNFTMHGGSSKVLQLNQRLNKMPKEFLKEINKISVEKGKFQVVKSAAYDCFDVLVVLRNNSLVETDNNFIRFIFLDCKSKNETVTKQDIHKAQKYNTSQYKTLKKTVSELQQDYVVNNQDIGLTDVGRALLENNSWLYVYFTTYPFKTKFQHNESLLHIGNQHTEKFLGILYELYTVISQLSNDNQ